MGVDKYATSYDQGGYDDEASGTYVDGLLASENEYGFNLSPGYWFPFELEPWYNNYPVRTCFSHQTLPNTATIYNQNGQVFYNFYDSGTNYGIDASATFHSAYDGWNVGWAHMVVMRNENYYSQYANKKFNFILAPPSFAPPSGTLISSNTDKTTVQSGNYFEFTSSVPASMINNGTVTSGNITPIDTSNIPSYIGFNGAQINTPTTTNNYTYTCQLGEFRGLDSSNANNFTYVTYCPLSSVPSAVKKAVSCDMLSTERGRGDQDFTYDYYEVIYNDGTRARILRKPDDWDANYAPACGDWDL